MRWRLALALLCVLVLASPVSAATPKNKGLYITPTRDYITAPTGESTRRSVTLANYTDVPLAVSVAVQQFTVADYTYNFQFQPATDNWVALEANSVALQPGQSQSVAYTIAPPKTATPGGHYFTIMATATIQDGTNKSQVQAATAVYVTVPGALTTTSKVQNVSIPRVAFGDIPFTFDVKDTGNTHFFIYVLGGLSGLGTPAQDAASTHLLLPQAVRRVGGTITAPVWPGVYQATYGYKTDTGKTLQLVSHIIYLPPWFIAVAVGLVWIGVVAFLRWRRKTRARGF